MNLPMILGWIGNAGFFFGVYALGRKWRIGWYANILGNALYLWQGIIMQNTPLIFCSFVLAVLNVQGIRKWIKMEKENVKSDCRCCKNCKN